MWLGKDCNQGEKVWYGESVTAIPGMSSSTTCATGPRVEPFLKRGLALPEWYAGEEAFDTDVFVKFVRANAVPSADQSPALAFC